MPLQLLRYLIANPAYALSAFVGGRTYAAYAVLNEAWTNPALIAIALFLFLSTPLYSKYSNRIEAIAARLTTLETGGRVACYLFQLVDNLILLWVLVAGQVIEPAGLAAIGGCSPPPPGSRLHRRANSVWRTALLAVGSDNQTAMSLWHLPSTRA